MIVLLQLSSLTISYGRQANLSVLSLVNPIRLVEVSSDIIIIRAASLNYLYVV